jgi:hypothetical protein
MPKPATASASRSADRAYSAVLKRAAADWRFLAEPGALDHALLRARYHGASALLLQRPAEIPPALRALLQVEARQFAMWELADAEWVRRALEGLRRAGVPAIVFKGAALAYSLYADSAERMRADTDLLTAPEDRRAAETALTAMGWRRLPGARGQLTSGQASYAVDADGGHTIDLHWRLSDSPLLSRMFGFRELLTHSQPLPRLSPLARGPSFVAALAIACVHMRYHAVVPYFVDGVAHAGDRRLIWHCDIRALASQFEESDWAEFGTLAGARGVAAPCADALTAACERVGAPVPSAALRKLHEAPRDTAAARFLRAARLGRVWTEATALASWRERAQFFEEKLFPDAELMQGRYGPPAALPWLYVRRLAQEAAALWRAS